MVRWKVAISVFVVTAVAVDAFLYAADFVFPGPLYWPAVLVSLPGLPFIVVGDLVLHSMHTLYCFVFPAVVWGIVAGGVAFQVAGKDGPA